MTGVPDVALPIFVDVGVAPSQVGEVAIDGAAENDGVALLELAHAVIESNDLGGANEGKVERVEVKNDFLATVIGQADVLERTVSHDGGRFEVGSFFGY